MQILGIPGSLRRGSFNRQLLVAAGHELGDAAALTIWDGLAAVPLFDEDLESAPAPAGVASLRAAIEAASAVLIATPEYNGSIPGPLKNAMDWASRPRGEAALDGKLVAVVSASPTPYGAMRAQEQLRTALRLSGANVVGGELAVPEAFRQFDRDERLAEADLRSRLAAIVAELAEAARADAGDAEQVRR